MTGNLLVLCVVRLLNHEGTRTNQFSLHHQSLSAQSICRDLSRYADGSFAGVLDKGTLDAVLCCKGGHADVTKYVNEVFR